MRHLLHVTPHLTAAVLVLPVMMPATRLPAGASLSLWCILFSSQCGAYRRCVGVSGGGEARAPQSAGDALQVCSVVLNSQWASVPVKATTTARMAAGGTAALFCVARQLYLTVHLMLILWVFCGGRREVEGMRTEFL
ncbi:hypothetical protein TcCL_ESM10249 [Trypanosoma cruzi]|nr:hypothetical protein TcCL_ESM10249 [Trypanosoma cruzi]